ncbi:MAG: DNA repair protein RadA, partial [Ruminococcaceae bacterium]|nr:DNA repair protein RadA [Oscillospiraceae bacterium]
MKSKTTFICQECGYTSQKWLGKCPGCENWNTMLEETVVPAAKGDPLFTTGADPVSIRAITADREGTRLGTGVGELDQVLGGGLVTGSLVLVGGDPG